MDQQESQEEGPRAPETFADLSQERQRMWAGQQETQLFLAQLRKDRDMACETRDAALDNEKYGPANKAAGALTVLNYLINTIESANAQ